MGRKGKNWVESVKGRMDGKYRLGGKGEREETKEGMEEKRE